MGQVLEITNRGKRGYKQGQLKGFQIGAKRIQIRARRFQIEVVITNWCRTAITLQIAFGRTELNASLFIFCFLPKRIGFGRTELNASLFIFCFFAQKDWFCMF